AWRIEVALWDELLPCFSTQFLNDLTSRREHQVVVQKLRPDWRRGFEVTQTIPELAPCEAGLVPDGVVTRDAGPMRQHVTDRHRAIEVVVVEPNRRNELLDRLVPA